MKLRRVTFPQSVRLWGAKFISSVDLDHDGQHYALELKPELSCVNVTCLTGELAGRVFGIPYSSCTWEYDLRPGLNPRMKLPDSDPIAKKAAKK